MPGRHFVQLFLFYSRRLFRAGRKLIRLGLYGCRVREKIGLTDDSTHTQKDIAIYLSRDSVDVELRRVSLKFIVPRRPITENDG